jgi:hypothetical protein
MTLMYKCDKCNQITTAELNEVTLRKADKTVHVFESLTNVKHVCPPCFERLEKWFRSPTA